jgi:hypothetical protein
VTDISEEQLRDGVARTWGPERAADPNVDEAARTAAAHLARIAREELDPDAESPAG